MKSILFIFLFLIFLNNSNSYKLCVVGAGSGLGKELVYQSLLYKNNVLALTSNPYKVSLPFRLGGLNDPRSNEELFKNRIISDKLEIDNYWNDINSQYDYDHLIFTTGGTAFTDDYSFKLTSKFMDTLPETCRTVSLISADGVGDSLKNSSIGIKVMNNWYLKDVYKSKNLQEICLNAYTNNKIGKFIYRPNALSYGESNFDTTARFQLASIILDKIKLYDINLNTN